MCVEDPPTLANRKILRQTFCSVLERSTMQVLFYIGVLYLVSASNLRSVATIMKKEHGSYEVWVRFLSQLTFTYTFFKASASAIFCTFLIFLHHVMHHFFDAPCHSEANFWIRLKTLSSILSWTQKSSKLFQLSDVLY